MADEFKQTLWKASDKPANTPVESFFKSLRVEEVYLNKYRNLQEARQKLFAHIMLPYTRKRKNAS